MVCFSWAFAALRGWTSPCGNKMPYQALTAKLLKKKKKVYLFVWLGQVLVAACGIQFSNQGLNLGPLPWKLRVLTTGPPGKLPSYFLKLQYQQTLPEETKNVTILRESVPRQIEKKSRVPKEEKGVWGSRSGDQGSGILKEEKRTNSFSLYIPQSITQLSLNSVLGIIQQQCIRLEGSFSFLKTF